MVVFESMMEVYQMCNIVKGDRVFSDTWKTSCWLVSINITPKTGHSRLQKSYTLFCRHFFSVFIYF